MHISSSEDVCTNYVEIMKNRTKMADKRHPRRVHGVQNEPSGVQEASKRHPRDAKRHPGGAKLDLLVFYKVFKRPWSSGRMRCGALITYRLGRLTELNLAAHISNTKVFKRPRSPGRLRGIALITYRLGRLT